MDVKLTVGGVEAIVTVKDSAEAVDLITKIAASRNAPVVQNALPASLPFEPRRRHIELADDDDEPRKHDEIPQLYPESSIRGALLRLRGSLAGKVLQTIGEHPGGCLDSVVKKEADLDEDYNLGPAFSHISKAAKRFSLPTEVIVVRRKGRRAGQDRRVTYHYLMPPQTTQVMKTIPNFGEIEDLPGESSMT